MSVSFKRSRPEAPGGLLLSLFPLFLGPLRPLLPLTDATIILLPSGGLRP